MWIWLIAYTIDYGPIKSDNSGKHNFRKLPFTAREIKDIQEQLDQQHYTTTILRGKQATEVAFRRVSGQKNKILHIATHGYFERTNQITSGNTNNLIEPTLPLTRCRLAFAGANNRLNHIGNLENDGILTAQEITGLDLTGTDLVVLSACESGLGVVNIFEGIQGFQRAFTLAGAKYVLVSLWTISDQHTALLMRHFYQHLVAGDNKNTALMKAQLDIKAVNKSPYYWAGFMIIHG